MKDPARQAAQGFVAALRMTAGESAAMGNGCHREGRAMKDPARQTAQGFFAALRMTAGGSAAMGNDIPCKEHP